MQKNKNKIKEKKKKEKEKIRTKKFTLRRPSAITNNFHHA